MPDQLDFACELATTLLFTRDERKVIKESYSPELINYIDQADLCEYAGLMSFERAKIVIAGKDVLSRPEVVR